MERYVTNDALPDGSTGIGLEMLGAHFERYPDICPFCFNKFPEDVEDRAAHIRKCNKLLREIRDDQQKMRH